MANQRGGKRPGAGRKPGVSDKAKIAAQVAASGLSPLDFMLGVLRDESQPFERRQDMAKAAAPYVHPRLATVEQKGDLSLTVRVLKFSAPRT